MEMSGQLNVAEDVKRWLLYLEQVIKCALPEYDSTAWRAVVTFHYMCLTRIWLMSDYCS